LKLPLDEDGFFTEKDAQLQPNETSVRGIYLAGAIQQPMRTSEAATSASAAALKAITELQKK
jgi:heterodisulfide reductase subunit A-like polyferredoxin